MPVRFEALDAVRGVAALVVLGAHYAPPLGMSAFPSAYYAVDLFFCLSGLVLGHAYLSAIESGLSLRKFLGRRLARLYPIYVIAIVLGGAALLASYAQHRTELTPEQTLTAAALNILFLPFEHQSATQIGVHEVRGALFPLNDPAWSLFFELVVNLAFFVVVRVAGKRVIPWVALISGACLMLVIAKGHAQDGWGYGWTHLFSGLARSGTFFFLGAWLSTFGMKPVLRGRFLMAPCMLVAVVVTASLPANVYTTAIALLSVPVLVHLGHRISPPRGWAPICDALGQMSYPLYCLHIPLLMFADVSGVLPLAAQSGFTICLLFLTPIVLSSVAAYVYETPVRQWLLRGIERRALPSRMNQA